jgi:hypothetical protein
VNDNVEQEDFGFQKHRTLIGQGDDWPEYYDHGFDAPMEVISEILRGSRDRRPVDFVVGGSLRLEECQEIVEVPRNGSSLQVTNQTLCAKGKLTADVRWRKRMRAIAIADNDSLVGHLEASSIDVLISLGDLWDKTIEIARDRYQPNALFPVRGNHDLDAPFPPFVTALHLTFGSYLDMTFGGFNGSWRYKPRGPHLYDQAEVVRPLRSFPRVDVFVAHNSPRGFHERDEEVHQGFDGFLDYIERTQPHLFIHGHQHLNLATKIGETTLIGVCPTHRRAIGVRAHLDHVLAAPAADQLVPLFIHGWPDSWITFSRVLPLLPGGGRPARVRRLRSSGIRLTIPEMGADHCLSGCPRDQARDAGWPFVRQLRRTADSDRSAAEGWNSKSGSIACLQSPLQ